MRRIDFTDLNCHNGFTLIEIIVTIIISSVLAVILAQVMANQTTRSYRPVETVSDEFALRAVMADIAADWKTISADATIFDTLGTLQDRVNNGDYWSEKKAFSGHPEFVIRRNHCIKFDTNGNEQEAAAGDGDCAADDTVLKVSIAIADSEHHLTTLFAR